MLHQKRDIVIITVPQGRLNKYDVALYRRGDLHVLHRVIGVEDGYYRIRGDNTYYIEKVPDRDVIGVLTEFTRKGKRIAATDGAYRAYVRIWCAIYPLRHIYAAARRGAYKLARRLGLIPALKKLLRRK